MNDLDLVSQKGYAIKHIKNPTAAVQLAAVKSLIDMYKPAVTDGVFRAGCIRCKAEEISEHLHRKIPLVLHKYIPEFIESLQSE